MTWDELARMQGGVVSRRQLLERGVSERQVSRLVTSNQLVVQSRGVFLARGAPESYRAALWTSLLRTSGVLGFGTAVHIWGGIERPPEVDIVVHPRRKVTPAKHERIHRVIVPDSALVSVDEMPITTREWSLLDYAGSLSVNDALLLVDRAVQQRWLTLSTVRDRVTAHPHRTGNTVLRQVLAIAEDGAAAESERRLHSILRSANIGGWLPNYAVRTHGRLIAVVDVAFPEARLALEMDGVAFHTDTERFIRDRQRQNDLVADGWTVLRFTWWDLQRPDEVVGRIVRHLA